MTDGPVPEATPDARTLDVGDGTISVGGYVLGDWDGETITLNLGWLRAAGVGLRVEADPRVDRKRNGLVLDRPAVR